MNPTRVLLLGGNFKPELTGIGKYNGEMIDWLAANGYDCAVVTTYPYYPEWSVSPAYKNKSYWYSSTKTAMGTGSIRVMRCPHYVPKSPSGGKRMLSDFSFFISAFFRLLAVIFTHKKYHHVIAVAPPFHIGMLALLYKWTRGAKMVYHIQDLQIDAANELGMVKQKWLIRLLMKAELFILKRTDHISSISAGMIGKIKAKLDRPVLFFPNWVNTEELYPITDKTGLKEKFGFPATSKLVLYSGAIGEKQGLDQILEAASKLRGEAICFAICGTGPYKEKLEEIAKAMGLDNVRFLALQPKEVFNDFLNSADLHLVIQKANANDLVMPSKLTGILAVGGLALVTAPADSSLYRYISGENIAVLALPDNQSSITQGIYQALFNPPAGVRTNAWNFAENTLNIERIMPRFLESINAAMAKPAAEVNNPPVRIISE
ncbi:MAG: colanic acid biosynthesis glycosyltransferase WcaI [Chitinophagaceae bacterium]|nr:MAG: colanic acid biosynthesis glycosyltransferase WcaI [Chitinophagaceae bacterium]